jgi:hypothetical protein
MLTRSRVAAMVVIYALSCLAWLVLAGVMESRTHGQEARLGGQVTELWGQPQHQAAPELTITWETERDEERTETVGRQVKVIRTRVREAHQARVSPESSDVSVSLHLDERLKGLLWYALYDVKFDGAWTYRHDHPLPATLAVAFSFPDRQGLYDGFRLYVDGVDRSATLHPVEGQVRTEVAVAPGQEVGLRVTYASRGKDTWGYAPNPDVDTIRNFRLAMTTDFATIDFPPGSMSPSTRVRAGEGWALGWDFSRAVTGRWMGMVMPARVQPGELARTLSLSAPISLFFFFLVTYVLALLRRVDVHPVNFIFLAASFFAFHLLFGYAVDHLPVAGAFALASVVSVALVVSYMRLVVSARFALREMAAAQLVYLVGFSLAHFLDGFTGLTVTTLAILTLFLLMQATGRFRWGEITAAGAAREDRPSTPAPATGRSPVTSAAPHAAGVFPGSDGAA